MTLPKPPQPRALLLTCKADPALHRDYKDTGLQGEVGRWPSQGGPQHPSWKGSGGLPVGTASWAAIPPIPEERWG